MNLNYFVLVENGNLIHIRSSPLTETEKLILKKLADIQDAVRENSDTLNRRIDSLLQGVGEVNDAFDLEAHRNRKTVRKLDQEVKALKEQNSQLRQRVACLKNSFSKLEKFNSHSILFV